MPLGTIPSFTVERSRASKQQEQSDALTWITARKGVRLRRTSAQTITTATYTEIQWNAEDQDTDAFWSSGVNTDIIVPTGLGGMYAITATLTFAAATTGTRNFITLAVTSSITGVPTNVLQNSGAGEDQLSSSAVLPLAAADIISVAVLHNHGSDRTVTGTFNMYRIGE